MYLYIETLKQRLDAINQLRVDRALAAMGPAFRQVYGLLPTLLHYHHPLMPGYLDGNVPHGICFYAPDEKQQTYLNEIMQRQPGDLNAEPVGEPPITGVYSMGSTSSVGQSCSSDLDIWVCHQSWLDADERQRLQQKCTRLEKWAASLGVDVSFFLIDENRFRHNESGSLGGEDCGSTQHILLLDEFYRTAVRMAGKRILWNLVPCEEEAHYDEYVLSLYARGALTPNEWLDLGGLGTLSAEEYFGASLWQLYKSIDSPYKAVLKTLLLEAYSWEYPNTDLLAMDIKQRLHKGEIVSFGLDPYCMMLERVTRYLELINDPTRLDLVRRCFYLKVCEKLSRARACVGWRREILTQLVAQWGWDEKRIEMLDNRANWKIEQVREAHNELLDAMMQSYRNLIRFARRNNLSVSASPQDIGVLTRKLYAAFEALPGKVTLVNPQISPDLSEKHLTFVHVPIGRANRAGWYLYNRAPTIETIISHQPLEYNRYLNKLVAWAYFNGLLMPDTQLHIKSSNNLCDLNKLQELVHDVGQHFPIRLPAPTPKALYSPCEIRHLAIIVNLENDPTSAFRNQVVHFDFRKLDVFSFGQQQQCLIGSIDLLYRNSWNEVRTLHFSGEQAVLEALKTILGKMHQDAAPPEAVEVFCYSAHLRGLIRTRLQQLVSECIELRLSSTRLEPGRFKAVRVAGQTWGLFFERLSVSVQKLENAIEFYGAISNNKLHGLPTVQVETKQVHLPGVVDGYASEGIIQFFFEDGDDEGFNIYILDETNRVEVYHHCEGSKEELVRDVSRFYSSSHDRFTYGSSFINFNLPQFYQIVNIDGQAQVVPFRSTSLSQLCMNTDEGEATSPLKQRFQLH
ncbi:class I adenylate cyclase [Enterobacillus tribolii]|uniref:Adenylate cyclase n=1 Tax=Enterobacillus tribolii TaxID=1487935 RepID=A0A370Q9U7_9GAMM|nr:class I adenylate cyclase [Enterobacillus tribolii]MBW7984501.1 class I adenylate cyclase [Enterobacillus tribolii]RDK85117.1 adenylate cyclase class 1 [Enterobacillus tribolii]